MAIAIMLYVLGAVEVYMVRRKHREFSMTTRIAACGGWPIFVVIGLIWDVE